MAEFNKETIKTLTELSRIHCSEEEEHALYEDLRKILHYVEQLQEINTDNVEPCNHVLEEVSNVMRDDELRDTLPREQFLSNAPEHSDGMIRVPPIIKQHG